MSQFVSRARPAHRERVAALRRTLIVVDIQRVRSGLVLIILGA
jgi:hypothetical protein